MFVFMKPMRFLCSILTFLSYVQTFKKSPVEVLYHALLKAI